VLAIALFAPAVAAALSPADAISNLNRARVAHGIPGSVVENPVWSAHCQIHSVYGKLNGVLTHGEDAAKPGFSADGDWAGKNSVLASGYLGWDPVPWANAPLHLYQLYFPGLKSTGYGEHDGYACMVTWAGASFALAPATFTFPGNGVAGVAPDQIAYERPFVPQEFVGIPQGTRTGPNMFLYRTDYDVDLDSVKMTPPVAVKWIDKSSDTVGAYLPRGAILIPVSPLRAGTKYTVVASGHKFNAPGTTFTKTWSFTTSGSSGAGGGGAGAASGASGSASSDSLSGTAQNDKIKGKGGDDVIRGGPGNDRLWGDAGNDRIFGDAGNDVIVGGTGKDTIKCGKGKDKVVAGRSDKVARDCERVKRKGA
jgi:hypothetical protein